MEGINKQFKKLNNVIVDFLSRLKQEGSETSDAVVILSRYARGEKVSKEDMDEFRNQMIDVVKVIGIGIPFTLIPGSTLLLPLVLSVAKKYNIDILPSSFKNTTSKIEDIEDLFLEYIDKYNLSNTKDIENFDSYYIDEVNDNQYEFLLNIFINSDKSILLNEDIYFFSKRLNKFGFKLETIINTKCDNHQWYILISIKRK